jgi:hypothetical protein
MSPVNGLADATFGFSNRSVVDAGNAAPQEAFVVEFPELVVVGAKPVAGIVVSLVLEGNGDAVLIPPPERFLSR